MKTITQLHEDLISNIEAVRYLDNYYKQTKSAEYYKIFGTEFMRDEKLKHIIEVKKRVLRMRYRTLENIKRKTEFYMNECSIQQRELLDYGNKN